jgi:hypothetical protein
MPDEAPLDPNRRQFLATAGSLSVGAIAAHSAVANASIDSPVIPADKPPSPLEEIKVRPIGRLVLNRTVDNFFAETEQVAFCTQNIVPGIDFSDDPLLQGRNFSYLDTQLKRLSGPNFTHFV